MRLEARGLSHNYKSFKTRVANHPTDLIDLLQNGLCVRFFKVTQPSCQQELSVQFEERTTSHRYVMSILPGGLPFVSFGNIGRHGYRRTSHLRNQSPLFYRRKFRRYPIDSFNQIHTPLPDPKIIMATDHSARRDSIGFTEASSLAPHAYFPYTRSINPSCSSSRTMLSSIKLSTVTLLPGACFKASSN